MNKNVYQETDMIVLLVVIVLLIITFTYLFNKIANPFAPGHKAYSLYLQPFFDDPAIHLIKKQFR